MRLDLRSNSLPTAKNAGSQLTAGFALHAFERDLDFRWLVNAFSAGVEERVVAFVRGGDPR